MGVSGVGASRAAFSAQRQAHGAQGENLLFKSRVGSACISFVIAGAIAGCNQVALQSEEVGEIQQALCVEGDGVHAVMAALAVAAAMELGRWQPALDFALERGSLVLSDVGKSQCDDGACWNTQAILDLQRAGRDEVEFEHARFSGDALQRRLRQQYGEQLRCDSGPGRGRGKCVAELHALSFAATSSDVCATVFTFDATTPDGGLLSDPADLANKLVFVGYPENPYLAFASTERSVSIDPTYGLNDDPNTTAGQCSATCTKIASSDVTGQCCMCNGSSGAYARSPFSTAVYLCR